MLLSHRFFSELSQHVYNFYFLQQIQIGGKNKAELPLDLAPFPFEENGEFPPGLQTMYGEKHVRLNMLNKFRAKYLPTLCL